MFALFLFMNLNRYRQNSNKIDGVESMAELYKYLLQNDYMASENTLEDFDYAVWHI